MNKILNTTLLILFITSCSSTTIIRTHDKDANIYIDNKYYGKNTVVYTDAKISFLSTEIRIEKENCPTQNLTLVKNERFDYVSIISGVLMIVPLLWIRKYNPVHNIEVQCI